MGYVTIAYGVDIDRLAAVKGSRDAELLSTLEQKFADDLRRLDELQQRSGAIYFSVRDALRRLVDGNLGRTIEASAPQYVLAYELLCRHFGKLLDGQGHIKFVDDLGWDTDAAGYSTPLGLAPGIGIPTTSYLNPLKVQEEYQRFKDEDTEEGMDPDDPWLPDAREEFIWWLKQCANEGLGLVTFCF